MSARDAHAIEALRERVEELERKEERQTQRIEQQATRIDELEDTVDEQQERLGEQADRIEAQAGRIDDQDERIGVLLRERARDRQRIAELEDYRAENEHDKATIRRQLTGLEETSTEASQQGTSAGSSDRRSSLAQIIDVPAQKAKEFLTTNQFRGRWIAQRAIELGQQTPSGLVVSSKAIRRQLNQWDESAHSETVSRVMDFIAKLGGDDVRSKLHKGRRILIFNPDRVREYGTGEEPSEIRSQREVIWSQETGPTSAAV